MTMTNHMRMRLFPAALIFSAGFAVADVGRAGGIVVRGKPGGGEASAILEPGVRLFSDRPYIMAECPELLRGLSFLQTSIDGSRVRVDAAGRLYVITMESNEHGSARGGELEAVGFRRVEEPQTFQLFGDQPVHRSRLYVRDVAAGDRFVFSKASIVAGFDSLSVSDGSPAPWSENDGETLYNGIRLPSVWPPDHFVPESDAPMPVPCLDHPPAVIAIDVGRQLFVDDFLIDATDMKRTFHRAEKHLGNPVLVAESVDEIQRLGSMYLGHGGIVFDRQSGLFRMAYTAGWRGPLAMATSRNMIRWDRPDLGDGRGNILLPVGPEWKGPDAGTAGSDHSLWFDVDAANPAGRLKFLTCWMHVPSERRPKGFNHSLQTSADGRAWSSALPTSIAAEDYCSFFYNPFRKVWVYSIKQGGPRGRCRYYAENKDFLKGADWSGAVYWTNADALDLPEPEGGYPGAGEPTQLYSLNAVAYESLLIGMHYIHRGPNNKICADGGFPKLTDLELGFSRDGFHWHRPDRSGFITGTRRDGDWDRAYLHGATGVFVVLGDRLVFPYTGFSGVAPDGSRGIYHGASIGIATLRRDGFASMDAGAPAGTLTTRPVTFPGARLFVNANCPKGELRAEILAEDGTVIEPFSLTNSVPFAGDSTLHAMQWQGGGDLAALAGRPVRFRFSLRNGSLYAFWVSRDESGRSDGYVAMGGPGYTGPTDTVGRAALE